MKKKKWITIGIIVILVFLVCGIILVSQSPKWSEMSFEAIVKETVIQPDGESRLIVERTTEIYSNPINSLGISENTKLFDADGNEIIISNFQQGDAVKVILKNAFTEETPFYYPIVYEIRLIDVGK